MKGQLLTLSGKFGYEVHLVRFKTIFARLFN
jgi:hypothetical protein